MITAGIDMGAQDIKVVVVNDGQVVARTMAPTGFDPLEAAQRALDEAIEQARVSRDDIKSIVSTGAGRKAVNFADAA